MQQEEEWDAAVKSLVYNAPDISIAASEEPKMPDVCVMPPNRRLLDQMDETFSQELLRMIKESEIIHVGREILLLNHNI